MDRKSLRQAILWVLLFVAVLAAAVFVNTLLTDADFSASARAVQAMVTAIAIVVAAIFAIFKLQIFRDFAPHLTISQKVSHRAIGDSYIHIYVAATLENSSKVKVELRQGLFLLQRVAPASDEDIEALYATVFINRSYPDIPWPVIGEMHRSWDENSQIIEPGESHQEVCEFIAPVDVKSVLVYSYFHNPYSSAPWGCESTTIHDIS